MLKSENPFVCFLPQLPSLLPVVSYTSGKLITDINQNLLIVVLEMEKVCHFLSELITKTKNMTTIHVGSWWQKQH